MLEASSARKQAVGEPASDPQLLDRVTVRCQFVDTDRRQLDEGDPARERLGRLSKQFQRRGAQNKELPRTKSGAPALIHDASKDRKQLGRSVNFVEDH